MMHQLHVASLTSVIVKESNMSVLVTSDCYW